MKYHLGSSLLFIATVTFLSVALAAAHEIHEAAQQGDLDRVKALIDASPELINATDEYGHTPLHLAASGGQNEIAEFLLAKDADVKVLNIQNQSALLYAAYFGNAKILEMLAARGARLNEPDILGRTPLHYAARQHNLEALMSLIANKAELDAKDSTGETPLYFSVRWGYDDIVKILIDAGADLDVATNDGKTHLHMASIKGYTAVADLLINRGMKVSAIDGIGKTPLDYAMKYGNKNTADLLVKHDAKAGEIEAESAPAAQLNKELKLGEASIWYLGHGGCAVKTKDHLLIFDYWGYGKQPDGPCLANGHINVDEIKDQNVYVLVTHNHADHLDSVIFDWQKSISNITYIFGWQDSADTKNIRMGPREKRKVADIDIETINSPEAEETSGNFLVRVDGLVIHHAGGYCHDTTRYDVFKKDIDYLAEIAHGADILFGRVGNDWQKEEALRTMELVQPKVMFPLHARERESVNKDLAEKAAQRNTATVVVCVENRGDNFFYSKGIIIR
jgi:ankyrin repeat protein